MKNGGAIFFSLLSAILISFIFTMSRFDRIENKLIKEINKPTHVYYEYNVVGNDTIPVDTIFVKN